MPTTWRRPLGVIAAASFALTGCGRGKPPAPAGDAGLIGRAVQVAEDQIRTDTKVAGVRFRGVLPWTQALPNRVAVCGQVALFGAGSETYVPFVAVVAGGDGGAPPRVETEDIGSTVDGASRVYLSLVDHCYEKGGPKPPPDQNVASLPPVPNNLPNPAAPPPASPPQAAGPAQAVPAATPPASPGGAVPEQTAASGEVTMRQNGNLHDAPHGAVTRVVQQGTAMKVFAQAPGGWYEVGDTAPWGWIHSSMLDMH